MRCYLLLLGSLMLILGLTTAVPAYAGTASSPDGHVVSIGDVTIVQGECATLPIVYTLPPRSDGYPTYPSIEGYGLLILGGGSDLPLVVVAHEQYFSTTRFENVPATYHFQTGDNPIPAELCDYGRTATSGAHTATAYGSCSYFSLSDYIRSTDSECSDGLGFAPLTITYNVTVVPAPAPVGEPTKRCLAARKILKKAKKSHKPPAVVKQAKKKVRRTC